MDGSNDTPETPTEEKEHVRNWSQSEAARVAIWKATGVLIGQTDGGEEKSDEPARKADGDTDGGL